MYIRYAIPWINFPFISNINYLLFPSFISFAPGSFSNSQELQHMLSVKTTVLEF